MKKTHLIQQGDHYWKPNSKGYSFNLWEAGLYTKEEAERKQSYNRSPLDKAIPITQKHIQQLEDLHSAIERKLLEFNEAINGQSDS